MRASSPWPTRSTRSPAIASIAVAKSYEAAAQELDDWAGRQFDPKVVEAFHRVPKEDWEELHRLSLLPKPDQFDVRELVHQIDSQLEVAGLSRG